MTTKKTTKPKPRPRSKPQLRKVEPKVEPEHSNTADLEGLNAIYTTLGTIRQATIKHTDLMRGSCSCGDSMVSVNILLGSAQEAIGEIILKHHK